VGLYLFLGALLVRLLYLSQYANSPFFLVPALDSLYHDLHARAIAAGKGTEGAFFRAPLYYYFLGGVYRVFGHSLWAARLIQAMLGSGSCVLLHALGRRLFRPTVALIAAAAMALYGPLVYFDGELLTPVVEVFLDLLFLLLAVRALESGRRREWLATGLVLGLSAITRPNVLVAAPLVLLAMGWSWWGGRREVGEYGGVGGRQPSARASRSGMQRPRAPASLPARNGRRGGFRVPAVLFLAGTMLAPGLVTLRNYRVSGDPVFIASQGGINLYLGNRPGADGFTPSTPRRYRFDGPYEDSVALYGRRAAEEALGRPLSASQAQSFWVKQSLRWWRDDLPAALGLTWKKFALAWTHREIRNNHAYDFVRAEFAPLLWACPFGFWFAGPLGLLGIGLAWRERKAAPEGSGPGRRLLALFVFLYVASFVLFFVADRYRLPVVPPLLLFGAHALAGLWDRFRTREWRRLAPMAAALAALVLFVNGDWYRTVTPATWAVDYWSAGNRSREMGRLAEAEAQYRKGLALEPRNAEIWTNLGAVQYDTGRVTEAEGSFRRSIALAPASGSGYYNLAMCDLRQGRLRQARRRLEVAVRLDPEHRTARVELARLDRARQCEETRSP
jgi:tetratricopeptide (TPR) repeat protein